MPIGHIQINVADVNGGVGDATEILGLPVTHTGRDQTWLSSNGRAAGLVLHHSSESSADPVACEPKVITSLARPGNVRAMNVWGTPAPLEWRQHHFPFTGI